MLFYYYRSNLSSPQAHIWYAIRLMFTKCVIQVLVLSEIRPQARSYWSDTQMVKLFRFINQQFFQTELISNSEQHRFHFSQDSLGSFEPPRFPRANLYARRRDPGYSFANFNLRGLQNDPREISTISIVVSFAGGQQRNLS